MSADRRFDVLDLPFTDDELVTAFRVLMSDGEAEVMVADLRSLQRAEIRRRAAYLRSNAEGQLPEAYGQAPAFGLGLDRDVLVVLSLLSSDLERRVATYLSYIEGRDMEGDPRWQERRQELRSWVATRLWLMTPPPT